MSEILQERKKEAYQRAKHASTGYIKNQLIGRMSALDEILSIIEQAENEEVNRYMEGYADALLLEEERKIIVQKVL
ncbi:hypothetical protein ACFL2C_01310 [Patescibacteria group bacterium]